MQHKATEAISQSHHFLDTHLPLGEFNVSFIRFSHYENINFIISAITPATAVPATYFN
jgi:hypothetical protein